MKFNKGIKFKIDKIGCIECKEVITVPKYKVNMPIPKMLPCSHFVKCMKKEEKKSTEIGQISKKTK